MKIGIIGGGITGLTCAYLAARRDHDVTLFEREGLMCGTSSSSSKLLHGGLRYLESGHFKLVKEALKERDGWIEKVPHLARAIPIIFPIYKQSRRSRLKISAGLRLYKFLATDSPFRNFKWLNKFKLLDLEPDLQEKGLIGGYEYYDGQMDDYALGMWVARKAKKNGATIHEYSEICEISTDGVIRKTKGEDNKFDFVINAAGPWAEALCKSMGDRPFKLDLIRGSHLIINRKLNSAFIFEVPTDNRIFFVLPWEGRTLLGTTEVRHNQADAIACSEDEKNYLLAAYNYYFSDNPISGSDIISDFSGVRPLIYSTSNFSSASREYGIFKSGKVISVVGGKWTTSLSLAEKVTSMLV